MKCEILAVGSEMLTPHRLDTNSLYLTGELNKLGVSVMFKTVVGDRLNDIAQAIRIALTRTDILFITGGLGPTEDDLSREAVAKALGIALKRDAKRVAEMHARYAARRRVMPENNLKQADVLEGADVLENSNGTAPAQWLDTTFSGYRKLIAMLPGPPREMKPLVETEILPRLQKILPEHHMATRTMKAAMIPESQVDALLAPIYTTYEDVETTILAHIGDIHLNLICTKPTLEEAEARVAELASRMEEALEDWLYTSENETLEQIVLYLLELKEATLSVAESCTGGMLGDRLTSIPGSSRSFLGGAIVYSDALKTLFAGVPAEVIREHGAVSEPVARALAEGIRLKTGSTYGVGITGVAGPGGGTEKKPVGLVYIALSDGEHTECHEHMFSGAWSGNATFDGRQRIRQSATQQALDYIRRRLR